MAKLICNDQKTGAQLGLRAIQEEQEIWGDKDINGLYLACGGAYQVHKFIKTHQNINFKRTYFIVSKL